jgi:hypothetical protein
MRQSIIAMLCVGASLVAPAFATAQSSNDAAQIDQQLNRDRAGEHAAYNSRNPAAIAAARAKARGDYRRDWQADHPRGGCGRAANIDRRLSASRAATSAAYKSGDPKRIAAARAAARPDFAADYHSDSQSKGCGG